MKNLTKIMVVFGMIAAMAGNPPPGIAKDVGTSAVPFDQETVKPFHIEVITMESVQVENFGMWPYTAEVTFQVNDMNAYKAERSWPAKAEHFTVMKSLQPDPVPILSNFDPGYFLWPIYRC